MKTYNNTNINKAKDQVKDIEVFGDGDLFKLLSKASSKSEKWMKSTKVMNLPNGCLVQVTTQQDSNVAEALQFIPDINLQIDENNKKIFVPI